MRIAVVGAGGLGGYYGALLARGGADVTFIARGTTLEALRRRGLTLKSPTHGEFTVPVQATDDPASVGPVDVVLFCVKSYDLESAAESIRPLIGPETAVVPVQNGVDASERLAAVLGAGCAVGGVGGLSARVEEPGVIVHAASPPKEISFGELDGRPSPRLERFLEVCEAAGITAELSDQIDVLRWQKFIFICAQALTALLRLPLGAILACPDSREFYRLVMEEVAAVGRAHGIPLPEDAAAQRFATVQHSNPTLRASQYYDLVAGRRLEVDTLNGTVVKLGRQHGVPTPYNFAIYAGLKPYAGGPPKLPDA